MATEYQTIRVPREDYERAIEAKADDETWGDYVTRCVNGDAPTPPGAYHRPATAADEDDVKLLLSRLDELERQLPEKVADEVMGRVQ